ncbi:hypothetical protein VNO80_04923 [Phaseolus coccineus]|uniref:Uncharacterized protein n=1 Tax=Phaseolus coccineus TaxID=3886 RepID=A0AAN9NYP1_PHACN
MKMGPDELYLVTRFLKLTQKLQLWVRPGWCSKNVLTFLNAPFSSGGSIMDSCTAVDQPNEDREKGVTLILTGSYTNKLSLGLILILQSLDTVVFVNYLEMQVAWTIKFLNHMALNSETKLGVPSMKKVLRFYILVTDTDAESLMKER